MSARASARVEPNPHGTPGTVLVLLPGARAIDVLDGRAPGFSSEQVEQAERQLAERSGAVVARVRQRAGDSWGAVRADLNARAGGQASVRVMVLAQHALVAHEALMLQRLASGLAYGTGDELAEKHMRNAAGLAVVASDALNKAYAIADEEGKAAKGGLVGSLMARVGAQAGPTQSPISPPGEGLLGAPPSQTEESK